MFCSYRPVFTYFCSSSLGSPVLFKFPLTYFLELLCRILKNFVESFCFAYFVLHTSSYLRLDACNISKWAPRMLLSSWFFKSLSDLAALCVSALMLWYISFISILMWMRFPSCLFLAAMEPLAVSSVFSDCDLFYFCFRLAKLLPNCSPKYCAFHDSSLFTFIIYTCPPVFVAWFRMYSVISLADTAVLFSFPWLLATSLLKLATTLPWYICFSYGLLTCAFLALPDSREDQERCALHDSSSAYLSWFSLWICSNARCRFWFFCLPSSPCVIRWAFQAGSSRRLRKSSQRSLAFPTAITLLSLAKFLLLPLSMCVRRDS